MAGWALPGKNAKKKITNFAFLAGFAVQNCDFENVLKPSE